MNEEFLAWSYWPAHFLAHLTSIFYVSSFPFTLEDDTARYNKKQLHYVSATLSLSVACLYRHEQKRETYLTIGKCLSAYAHTLTFSTNR